MIFGRQRAPRDGLDGSEAKPKIADINDEVAIDEIRASGLFDPEWYLATYKDIADVGIDPVVHYFVAGAAEGRLPGPQFRRFMVSWRVPRSRRFRYQPHSALPSRRPRHGPDPEGARRSPGVRFFSGGVSLRSAATGRKSPLGDRPRSLRPEPAAGRVSQGTGMPLPPVELSARIGSPHVGWLRGDRPRCKADDHPQPAGSLRLQRELAASTSAAVSGVSSGISPRRPGRPSFGAAMSTVPVSAGPWRT